MQRNIYLLYIISFFSRVLFWLGVWMFFYLQFTDYAGIGLLETVMIISLVLFEIPSGTIADRYGRKFALIAGLIFLIAGNIVMASAEGYSFLLLSVFLSSIGLAFQSGSGEALLYDTLKTEGRESVYEKIYANTQTLRLTGYAFGAISAGWLFTIDPALPFWLTAGATGVALLAASLLQEPPIHADKEEEGLLFWQKQNRGFYELTKSKPFFYSILFILLVSMPLVIVVEILTDALFIEIGYTPKQLGILVAIVTLGSAVFVQIAPWLQKHMPMIALVALLGIVAGITLYLAPVVGLVMAGGLFVIHNAMIEILNNVSSKYINANINPTYRATTLSTFNLLKSVPYAFLAYSIGYTMDAITAIQFASYVALTLIAISIVGFLVNLLFQER